MKRSDSEKITLFQNLVLCHLDSAYNYAYWLCHNKHDAEDICQEACTKAYSAFDRFEANNAKAWLLTIIRHTFLSNIRKNKQSAEIIPFDLHSQNDILPEALHDKHSPEIDLLRFNNQNIVRKAIDTLNTEHREIIILRELEDLSYSEIADILDCAIGTVMSRLSRARTQLNTILMHSFQTMEKKA